MAIIYTYPTKATPNTNDLILISDSEDSNKTKQVTIGSLPGGSGSGVSSVTSANAAITVADASTTPVLTSVAYSGGANIGHVPTGSGSSASVYLDGTGNWSTPAGSGGPGTGTEDTVPIWSTTSTLGDSLITQNALGTVLNVGSNIASFSTTAGVGSVFATQVSINGYSGVFGGKLKLGSPDGATPVTIEGPANGGAAYTLKLPSAAPTNNQVLEYTTSGNLGWINTPSGGGGGISYEEGSWTPTMFGAGSPTVTATGQYVKIGRNVTVWFSLVCTAGDTLAVARISGLPFNGQGASVYGHNGGASISVNTGNSANIRYVTGTSGGATTLDLKVFTTSSITLNGPLPETENIDYQYSIGYWPNSQGNFTVRGTYTYKSQS